MEGVPIALHGERSDMHGEPIAFKPIEELCHRDLGRLERDTLLERGY
jgi:hypothetical protein